MKVKSFILVLCMLLSAGTATSFAQTQSGVCGVDSANLRWTLSGDTLTVSGTGAMADYGILNSVPWFSYRDSITTVVIEDSVRSIGKEAFRDLVNLISVAIGDSVKDIGEGAFRACRSLTSVTIPDSVANIGYDAFAECDSLTSVIIGCSVTSIEDRAFAGCAGLTSVINKNPNPQPINGNVFNGVAISKLTLYVPFESTDAYDTTNVWKNFKRPLALLGYCGIDGKNLIWTLSDGVLTVSGTGAMADYNADSTSWFSYRDSIRTVVIENGVTSIGANAFYDCSSLNLVTISDSVTSIGDSAFYGCSSLDSITIPGSVTSIGAYAFSYSSLDSIAIPGSVTDIGDYAFRTCSSLTAINVDGDNDSYSSVDGVLFSDDTLIVYPAGRIGDYTIPASVDSIRNYAFADCSGLGSVTNLNPIPQAIDSTVFNGVPLSELTLYVPFESAGDYDTTNVWKDFKKPLALLGYCGADDKNLIWTLLDGVLTVSGTGAMADYSAGGTSWFSYRDSIRTVVIGTGVTSIGVNAFYNCSSLNFVTISDSVTSIGARAFYRCPGLAYVTIPDGVQTIGTEAFYDCSSLTSITIPASVDSIGNYAFSGCDSLTSVTNLNPKPQTINRNVFNGLTLGELTLYVPVESAVAYDTTNVWKEFKRPVALLGDCGENLAWVLSDSVLTVSGTGTMTNYSASNNAPWYLHRSSIRTIVTENGVAGIGDYAFSECAGLTSVTIGGSVASIGSYAFSGCAGLTSVAIGGSVANIGNYAFSGAGLPSVTIPTSVDSIGIYAFAYCDNLTSVTNLNPTPQTINGNVFNGLTLSKLALYVPADFEGAYDTTAVWKDFTINPSGVCGVGLTWKLSTEVLFISGTGSMPDYSDDSPAPWSSRSFSITTVEIGNGVNDIGYGAFAGCGNLTAINVAEGNPAYSSVDGVLFNQDTTVLILYPVRKAGYIIPAGVTTIGAYAFAGVGLTSVTIPITVTSIEAYAFAGAGLTSVTNRRPWPQEIDSTVFEGVVTDSLPLYVPAASEVAYAASPVWEKFRIIPPDVSDTSLTWSLADGVLTISGTGAMEDYDIPDGAPWSSYLDSVSAVVIETGVTSIGNSAFYGFAGLTSITIGDSVASIGTYAFAGCAGLIVVTNLNPTPQSIDSTAFDGLELSKLTLYVPAGSDTVYGAAEIWKDFTINRSGVCGDGLTWSLSTEVLFISGTGSMPDYSDDSPAPWSSRSSSITTVEIGKGVTKIGDGAFAGCGHLTAINVEKGNPSYSSKDGVLFNQDITVLILYPVNKAGYVIPPGVTTIGDSAFADAGLTSVTIPTSMTSLRAYAFAGAGLTSVTNRRPWPQAISSTAFKGIVTGSIPLYVPAGSEGDYKRADVWKKFRVSPSGVCGDSLIWALSDGVLTVSGTGTMTNYSGSNNAPWYSYRGSIRTVVIEDGVTGIGTHAFAGCTGLTSVINRNPSPQSIDSTVFAGVKISSLPLYVPVESAGAYDTTNVWKDFAIGEELTVESVSLDSTSAVFFIGDTLRLTATVLPEDATNRAVIWTSADETVATVSDGLVTAVGDGTARIEVKTADGNRVDYCFVTVSQKTAIPAVDAPTGRVYFRKPVLYVNSPVAEWVNIYSVTGTLLYKLEKPAGESSFIINRSGGILIVRGSSGWTGKVRN